VVFNRSVDWAENMRVVAWVAYLSRNEGARAASRRRQIVRTASCVCGFNFNFYIFPHSARWIRAISGCFVVLVVFYGLFQPLAVGFRLFFLDIWMNLVSWLPFSVKKIFDKGIHVPFLAYYLFVFALLAF